jgi:hypothetical protein
MFLIILLSNNFRSVTGDEENSIEDSSRKTQEIFNYWWVCGNWSGSIYNSSIISIFPPPEGDGIIYKNYSYIQKNVSNSVIFNLKLISFPNIYNITSFYEYHIQGEKIVAIYFTKNDLTSEINYSEVIFTMYSPEEKLLISQKIDLTSDITILSTPLLLDSSGLWTIKINFVLNNNSEDFRVWENVTNWHFNDDKYYLTFFLNSNLSFKNYYEKVIPVFSISEANGYWQALLTREQEIYLSDTANSSKVSAEASEKSAIWTMYAAIIAGITTGLALIITIMITWLNIRQSKKDKEEEKQYKKDIAKHMGEISTYFKENAKKDKVETKKK